MRKITFLLIAIAISAFSVNAQIWTSPTLTGSTPISGSTYYMYNVGSKGFLNRGGQWGAHAVVSAAPTANASTTVIKWTPVNTTGSTWTFQYNNGTNVANNFLFPASTTDGSIYTDNSTNNTWNVVQTDVTNNIYSIQINSGYGGYVVDQYLGSSAATETTNKGIANVVRYNRASGDTYTQWKFIAQSDYDLYNAKVLLDTYMNYAKLKGGISLTSYIDTYNAGVTADINTAATTLLTALGRTDVTSSITNPSFETNSFTGWTNSGSFALQNNTPGQGWTKAGTYYTEKYTGSGGNLGAGTITQTITGLSNGLYGMVASGHAVQQAGANPLHTGAFFTAGTLSTEIITGKDYSVEYIPVIDGTLTIGYKLEAPVACNWIGFDNFKLYYYGTMAIPSMTATETSFFLSSATTNTKTFNVSGANLTGDITITAPTGITLTGANLVNNGGGSYTIAKANANTSNAITATWDGLATLKSVKITIAESEVTTLNISVTTSNDNTCFTPLFSNLTNIITNPYCNDLSIFGGWGSTSIETSYVYCGASCIKVSGKCGGSLDYNLTGKITGNKTYRVKAMVSTNGTGEAKIGISGATATNITNTISTAVGEWLPVDFTFTTQATVSAPNMYFNSCEAQTATESYIDNYEMYDITSLTTGLNVVGLANQNVYVQNKKIVADFNLSAASKVEFDVYNTQGMLISKQVGSYNEGNNHVILNSNVTTGVYIVKTNIGGRFLINKIIF
jgi:hypothetical protein